jgi:hypothetical protein
MVVATDQLHDSDEWGFASLGDRVLTSTQGGALSDRIAAYLSGYLNLVALALLYFTNRYSEVLAGSRRKIPVWR